MPRLLSSFGFFVLAVVVLGASPGFAQTVPERFLGIWKDMEGADRKCSASDWNSDRHSDTHVRITPNRFEGHEQSCGIASINSSVRDDHDMPVRFRLACDVEGSKETREEVWQLQRIRGQRWLSVAHLLLGTAAVSLYQYCPDLPSLAPASATDMAPPVPPPAPPAARPVQQTEDYRNLPAVIRKEVERIRALCRDMQAGNSTDMQGIRYIQLNGQRGREPAILVNYLELCDGDAIGANCDNRGGCGLAIWTMRRDGTWRTILGETVYQRAFHVDGGSGLLVSIELVLNAGRPQCRPPRGAVFNKGDACRVIGRYQDGKWNWRKLQDLRN